MNINPGRSLTPNQILAAQKVIKEFDDVAEKMKTADNKDSVDINSAKGEVKLDFKPLGESNREKYTGELSFNAKTGETGEMSVIKNYDKPNGVGVSYNRHDHNDGEITFWKDDMYQEFPMYRQIDIVKVDKATGEIKSFESYEERDGETIIGGGGSDCEGYGGFFVAGH